jgi:hypothetical protein
LLSLSILSSNDLDFGDSSQLAFWSSIASLFVLQSSVGLDSDSGPNGYEIIEININ